jgi:hypothetical protein
LSAEFEAEEFDLDLPPGELIEGILALGQAVPSPIPYDHRTRPVIAGRDHPLEVGVFDRVIFDKDSQPFLSRTDRRTLWDSPAFKHVAHLQAEVVVETPRRVLLDDKETASAWTKTTKGFGCPLRVTFVSIIVELRLIHIDTDSIGNDLD